MLIPKWGSRKQVGAQRIAIRRLPPSWNDSNRSSAKRRSRHREDVRRFVQEVVEAAVPLSPQLYACPVRLDIWLFFGPDDDGDTDNRIIKTLQDALKLAGYFRDDCIVDQIRVNRVFTRVDRSHKTLVKLSPAPTVTEAEALLQFDS